MNNQLIRYVQKLSPLSPNLKFILLDLCLYTSTKSFKVWPSISQINKTTGLADRTIRRSLQHLKDKKLIIDTGARKGRTNSVIVYEINIELIIELSSPVTETDLSPVTETAVIHGSPVTESMEARSLTTGSPVIDDTHSINRPIQGSSDDDQSRACARETSSNFDQKESCTPPNPEPASPRARTYTERCTEIYHLKGLTPDYTLDQFLRHCDFLKRRDETTEPGAIHSMLKSGTFEIPGQPTITERKAQLAKRREFVAKMREKLPGTNEARSRTLDAAMCIVEHNERVGRYELELSFDHWEILIVEERNRAHYPYETFMFPEQPTEVKERLSDEDVHQLAAEAQERQRKANEEAQRQESAREEGIKRLREYAAKKIAELKAVGVTHEVC